jgi:ubiquinone/menaquinone biosynthesis C-methylase UbiE
MNHDKHIKSHESFAQGYDQQVKDYNSYGHEVLFGMCYEFVNPGDSLLDLGIGTGLSSVHFATAGLAITGLDGSAEMLNECKKKGFAKELKQYNIQHSPLPYADNTFSHVICCGVFHFFADLMSIIGEVHRLVKPEGIFSFTIASLDISDGGREPKNGEDYKEVPTVWGVSIFKHSDNYIQKLFQKVGFTVQKEQKVLAESGEKNGRDILFKVIVSQKI